MSHPADDSGASREAAIVARWRNPATRGAAFDELFGLLRDPVFAVCLHVAGNAADAEDAAQETFVAVYKGLGTFRGESRLSTWVHRIAVRMALRVRARRRPAAADVHAVDPPARGADSVLSRELGARLAAALDRLPAEHRIVISLFAVDGLAHAQIAEILGVPEGTVWSRLHAARKRLAAELGA